MKRIRMSWAFYLAATLASLGIIRIYHKDSIMDQSVVQQAKQQSISPVHAGLLQTEQDLASLFPRSVEEIKERTDAALADAKERLTKILCVPTEERTYQNTMYELDQLCAFSPIMIFHAIAELTSMVHPDTALRDAAREASSKLEAFFVDEISNNKPLYDAVKAYAERTQEELSDDQQYFITETLADFKRGGLDLPEEQRKKVAQLQKELSDLGRSFELNVAASNNTVTVPREALTGLEDDFIAGLKTTDDGQYILTTDYPTYFGVMGHCSVEETRKELSRAFENRAYPENEDVLKAIIAKRDELARELGFDSFTHLNLDNQMVKTPQRAETFLNELLERSAQKEQTEFNQLTAELPESVSLTEDGKMKSWDGAYVRAQYKKKHFNVDDRMIAEYFPTEHTLQQLLAIYEEFMGLSFKVKPADNLWHEDVKLVEAYDTHTQKLLGYLLLDLHPRPNKYTHACHGNIVPSVTLADGTQPYVVSLVIANFPKSTSTKPSLLKLSDVRTFFHEFGHALHGLLGRTNVASFSGTRVKTDFVELPSQMLEEWLWEKDILKRVSSHYVTSEPLSDDLIEKLVALKHFDTGAFVQRQAYLSLVSLNYYFAGADKDVAAVMRDLFIRTRPNCAYDDASHMFASFGHLNGYGAKYYGYMWSRVFGLDLFATIKENGFSREIGKRYVDQVLSKGGSQDPMELLIAFLGREPQQDAFFRDLGL